MTQRIRVAESVLRKAGRFGLQEHTPELARLLKQMARLSAIASGNFNRERRRYGAFILTISDKTVVDINCDFEEVCSMCLGTEITADGLDCVCVDTPPL